MDEGAGEGKRQERKNFDHGSASDTDIAKLVIVKTELDAEFLKQGGQELRKEDCAHDPHNDAVFGLGNVSLGRVVGLDNGNIPLQRGEALSGLLGNRFKFCYSGFHIPIMRRAAFVVNTLFQSLQDILLFI